MKKALLAIVTIMLLSTPAVAEVNKLYCMGTDSSDVYRFDTGNLYHSWLSRLEYLYGTYTEITDGPYGFTSGNMRFYLSRNLKQGYVIIADNVSWKVINLTCGVQQEIFSREEIETLNKFIDSMKKWEDSMSKIDCRAAYATYLKTLREEITSEILTKACGG